LKKPGDYIIPVYLSAGLFLSWMFIREVPDTDLNPYVYKLPEEYNGSEFLLQKNKYFSGPEFQLNSPENYFILYSVNGEEWKKTKQIVFNEESVHCPVLSVIPSSYKWKNPAGAFPRSAALRYCFISERKNERSPVYHQFISDGNHKLPVISLQCDNDDLFGFNNGIYIEGHSGLTETQNTFMIPWWKKNANYHQKGNKWERNAGFQFFDETGTNKFSTEAGLRIHGNATRAYPQKSLRLSASKKYGRAVFEYPFFEQNKITNYRHLILRNGGNDWDRTLMADGVIHEIIRSAGMDVQSYQPVVVYLNGEYWGIHSLRERNDENYIAEKYNIKKKTITVLDGKQLSFGKEEEWNDFNELLSLCRNKNERDSIKVKRVKEKINYENFLRYISLQLYFANTDWPANNVKQYKLGGKNISEEEQKWKWMIWDMDYSYGYTGKNAVNKDMFEHVLNSGTSTGILFSVLMNDQQFRTDLRKEIVLMLNTTLDEKVQNNVIDKSAEELSDEMDRHTRRWRKPAGEKEWNENILEIKKFISKRKNVLMEQTEKYLGPETGI